MKPSKHKMTVLSQIFKLIPRNLIPKITNEFGIDKQSRTFSPTSHVFALFFGQLTHALGLNDICDALRNHCGLLNKIRECTPPSRNGLSHNRQLHGLGKASQTQSGGKDAFPLGFAFVPSQFCTGENRRNLRFCGSFRGNFKTHRQNDLKMIFDEPNPVV